MGNCKDCAFWKSSPLDENNLGDCLKLSTRKRSGPGPDSNMTGVEAWPICYHDGRAFSFETKPWFGCIHYAVKK